MAIAHLSSIVSRKPKPVNPMRRYWRERPPKSIFRGAELPRLMTGLLMLAVIWMLIVRAREPGTWGWLAKVDAPPQADPPAAKSDGPRQPPPQTKPVVPASKAAEKRADKQAEKRLETEQAAKPKPMDAAAIAKPSGPTDEDPEQIEEARNEFQAVTDGTLKLGPEEMEAYDRLVEWVKSQPFAALAKRANQRCRYTHFFDDADKHRGELVALDVQVRLSDEAGKNRYGVPLYEAWADSEESRGRLYSLIVLDYPPGMPLVDAVRGRAEKARFVGYFLKLQGYYPAAAKPGEASDLAPLLIGRLEWVPPVMVKSPVDTAHEWLWGLALLAIIGVVFLLRAGYYKLIAKGRAATGNRWGSTPAGEAIPIESWLERAEFDDDGQPSSQYPMEIEPALHSECEGRGDSRADRRDLTGGGDDRLS